MKSLLFLISAILLSITIVVCKIWVIVSFILYLVKETPFNWTVFWVGLISLVVLLVGYIASIIYVEKTQTIPSVIKRDKSKFALSLDEAQKLQSERSK